MKIDLRNWIVEYSIN